MTDVTALGIPSIPAGAQIGGAGAAENQAQGAQQAAQEAQQQQQHQPEYQNTPAPVAPPVNPLQPALTQEQHPQTQPALKPNEAIQINPYGTKSPAATDAGTSYVETSINHLTTELGVSAEAFDAVFDRAIEYGDLTLINPHALGKDLTPEQTTRVQQLAQAAVQEYQQGIQNAKNQVYGIAGGEANWTTAVNAFNANAPQDIQEYASWLADNDLQKAANYVLNYNTQGGYVSQTEQAPLQGGTGNVAQGLTAAEYRQEIGKIEREAGNHSLGSPVYAPRIADIDARRALGRQQGK